MEISWQLILFIYVILAFALYGIFHWIEEVLGMSQCFMCQNAFMCNLQV